MTKEEIEKRIAVLRRAIPDQATRVDTLDAFQRAVKVVANGGYGAIGNVGFRYFRIGYATTISFIFTILVTVLLDKLFAKAQSI